MFIEPLHRNALSKSVTVLTELFIFITILIIRLRNKIMRTENNRIRQIISNKFSVFSFLAHFNKVQGNFLLIFIPHSLNHRPYNKGKFPFQTIFTSVLSQDMIRSLLYITPLLYLTTHMDSNWNINFVRKNQYLLTRLLQFECNRYVYRVVLVNAFVQISSTALFLGASAPNRNEYQECSWG
jgi:hypothetical protein